MVRRGEFFLDLALPFEILVFLLESADLRDHLLRSSLLPNLGRRLPPQNTLFPKD